MSLRRAGREDDGSEGDDELAHCNHIVPRRRRSERARMMPPRAGGANAHREAIRWPRGHAHSRDGGANFDTLHGFYDEVARRLIPGAYWGRNLDAFNDILRSGFGAPEGGFVLRWVHAARSQACLGYPETVRFLQATVRRCNPWRELRTSRVRRGRRRKSLPDGCPVAILTCTCAQSQPGEPAWVASTYGGALARSERVSLRRARLLWSTPADQVFDCTQSVFPSALTHSDGALVP